MFVLIKILLKKMIWWNQYKNEISKRKKTALKKRNEEIDDVADL